MVKSCINCGRVFGDAVIDYHQGLAQPPEPYPSVPHGVWYAKKTGPSTTPTNIYQTTFPKRGIA